jgi:hypothetical protein
MASAIFFIVLSHVEGLARVWVFTPQVNGLAKFISA